MVEPVGACRRERSAGRGRVSPPGTPGQPCQDGPGPGRPGAGPEVWPGSQERPLSPAGVGGAGGGEMPSLLPAHVRWPGAPQPGQEITGAPRGRPQAPLGGRQGGKEAIVGLCFGFPGGRAGLPEAPGSAPRASPHHSCPASPRRTPGTTTGPPGARLLKGQVPGGDAVPVRLGGGGRPGPELARPGGGRQRGAGVRVSQPSVGSRSRGAALWVEENVSGPEGATKKPKTSQSKAASGMPGQPPGGDRPSRSGPRGASARPGVQRAWGEVCARPWSQQARQCVPGCTVRVQAPVSTLTQSSRGLCGGWFRDLQVPKPTDARALASDAVAPARHLHLHSG